MDLSLILSVCSLVGSILGFIGVIVKHTSKIKELEMDIGYLKDADNKQEDKLEEISAQLTSISNSIIRLETKLEVSR